RHLWLSARALVLNSGLSKPLAIRDRRRFERRVTASLCKFARANLVPCDFGSTRRIIGNPRKRIGPPNISLSTFRTFFANHSPTRVFPVSEGFKSGLTRRIAVLGAPIDIGAPQRGTLMGPAALRTAGLLNLLGGLGFEVEDHGDLSISDMAELTDAPPEK